MNKRPVSSRSNSQLPVRTMIGFRFYGTTATVNSYFHCNISDISFFAHICRDSVLKSLSHLQILIPFFWVLSKGVISIATAVRQMSTTFKVRPEQTFHGIRLPIHTRNLLRKGQLCSGSFRTTSNPRLDLSTAPELCIQQSRSISAHIEARRCSVATEYSCSLPSHP
ncbi:hypothetical protein J3R30DRAFT_226204 [Lentinula aciculospora]|uniref:Uncharacterized protein n=1 Tax=Lentinula aciculospora TaxID=153920 RepID=A0A9W9AC50_9AGAR|nr:hypothetical protein J3R30DRAFT_226204 [Lentinula aciculospora]